MSVKTPVFKWDAPSLGEEANVPADLLSALTEIENTVKLLNPKYLGTAGAGDAGKLVVVDGTGVAAFQAMSGDATLAGTGALTIGEEKILTAKLKGLAVTAAKIAEEAVEGSKIKALAVTAAKIAEATITDAKLASPNNSVYKTVNRGYGTLAAGSAAGTYFFAQDNGALLTLPLAYGARFPAITQLRASDWVVAGKGQQMVLKVTTMAGKVAPAANFVYGLSAIGREFGNWTNFSNLAGTEITRNAPGINTLFRDESAEFAIPANSGHAVRLVTSAVPPAESFTTFMWELLAHNV